MEQKWVLLDFGNDLGVDIVETQFLEFPKDARHKLNNDAFNFEDDKDVTYCNTNNVNKKKKGQAATVSVTRYPTTVLLFGDSKSELKTPLDRALLGKDVKSTQSPLGRGKRATIRSTRLASDSSEEESDYDEGPARKRQTKEKEKTIAAKEKANAESIMERLMEKKKSAEPRVEPTCGLSSHKSLAQRVTALEEENRALRCSIAIMKDLPALLQATKKAICTSASSSPSPSPSPSSRPSASSSPIPSASRSPIPSASPSPIPFKLPKSTSSREPLAFVALQRDLNTSSGDCLMSKDEVAVLASSNPRAMVNDIMLKVFGKEVLVSHSLLGTKCNLHKEAETQRPALPAAKVNAIRDFVRGSFPGYADFNKHASEKMSNLRKHVKKKTGLQETGEDL